MPAFQGASAVLYHIEHLPLSAASSGNRGHGMEEYTTSFANGLALAAIAMVFALTMAMVVRRWVGADENWVGVLVRAGLLVGLFVFAIRRWGTVYSVAAVAVAPLMLVESVWRWRLTASWLKQQRRARAAEAARDVATDPASAMARFRLASALLEEGRLESGLEALEAAVTLAPADSRTMLQQMAEEAREEFVRECPVCRMPNPAAALACRTCFEPLSRSPLVHFALRYCLPAWRLLRL